MTLSSLSTGRYSILPELRRIQEKHGYLDRDELKRFSKSSGIPLYRLQAVASFFPHFRLTPAPAVTVKVCRDTACHLAGAASTLEDLRLLASDGVGVEGVSCPGRCDRPPAVCIGEFHYLGRTTDELKRIVSACVEGNASAEGADHDAGRPRYPSSGWMIDPYADGSRDYAAVKKFAAAKNEDLPREREEPGKTLPWIDAIFTELDDASLRGMGGAGQPARDKWRDVRDAVAEARRRQRDDRAFIVVNGDESEPATFKDRELLLHF